jgi:cytochrome c
MNPFGFLESLSRDIRCEADALPPPNASRERELSARPRSVTDAKWRDEWSTHAAVRRKEKYAAAVMLAASISAALAETAWAGELTPGTARGETTCETCKDGHSPDKNDVGPRHRGVFGRKAASLPDYDYSDALKSANIVWNEETLDQWLTNPQAVVPGAKMFFHLDNPQDRADVIAYLKERAK